METETITLTQSSRAQQTASDPSKSVWVAANAGTGKTKVLTDRVLRLLLKGVQPSRILCITYTKAAAAEMQNRIHSTLSIWIELSDNQLVDKIKLLTSEAVNERLLKRARTLFAKVLDAPDGVRIMTIHSFCQSLLRRFPLEAEVAPHFEVIDERTADELLAEARHRLLAQAIADDQSELADAIKLLAGRMAENRFQQLLAVLINQRAKFENVFTGEHSGVLRLKSRIAEALSVNDSDSELLIIQQFIKQNLSYDFALRVAINQLEQGASSDKKMADALARWCSASVEEREGLWGEYCAIWLTEKGELRAKVMTAKLETSYPDSADILREVQVRVAACVDSLRGLRLYRMTAASIVVVDILLRFYSELKSNHNLMDYDDLVLKVLKLFRRPGVAPWVLFKLDGGLEHLLVDEAQDTGPAQWELVGYLVAEFFAGKGGHEGIPIPRTLFVVGDEKQSIYGFQGAAPKAFGVKRHDFSALATQAGLDFAAVPLGLSYRSTEAVLRAVDAVFNQPHVRSGITYGDVSAIAHGAFREGQAGRVEVWPLVKSPERENYDLFSIKKENVFQYNTKNIVAERIANEIKNWLQRGEKLESQNRAITAGDILILVRKRADFVPAMVRALKHAGVPVAGADRLELVEHIAVKDLLALAEFLLLPEDDLSLACVLKSPLCNIEEETLFTLAHDRGKATLWSRVQNTELPAKAFLTRLLAAVDYARPYELFAKVLEEEEARYRYAARLGEEAFDPLDEFLALALQYEQGHVPSLQGFLQWMRTGRVEIKRDMEQGKDAVRIMTVHGAKGLQAPIVFLPDTTAKATGGNPGVCEPFWFEQEGRPLVLWSPSEKEDDALAAEQRKQRKREAEDEFRRLLYVAMTRASDRLYVCGWLGKRDKDVPEDCWYSWIQTAIKPMGKPCKSTFEGEEQESYFIDCPQTASPEAHKVEIQASPYVALPPHLLQLPAPEPFPPQPLVPSKGDDIAASTDASQTQKALLSPAREKESARFKRGNLVHRLLQFLPNIPSDTWEKAMIDYLSRFAKDYTEEQQKNLVNEVLAVLYHPQLSGVFSPDSLAEVPLTGLVTLADGKEHILSGQIDRLYITPEAVWIIDYKTGRDAPARVEDVPAVYLRQMALYKAALEKIYPEKPIHTALLWTSQPSLMVLPDALLVANG